MVVATAAHFSSCDPKVLCVYRQPTQFANTAICELALLRAAEDDVMDPQIEFWDEAMRLRDMLKFEFFFAEKDEFRAELAEELSFQDIHWEDELASGSESIQALVQRVHPFTGEAYSD